MNGPGNETALSDSSKSAIRSAGLSETERVAAVGWQLCREIFPAQQQESDLALKMRLKLLGQLVDEIGETRYMRAIEKAISISHNRWQVTVARIRECAGLYYVPPRQPAAVAWAHIIQVFIDHVRTDGNGNYVLEEKVRNVDGKAVVTPVPAVPAASLRAIRSLGGWAAIAEAWPEYTAQRFREFKDLYEPEV